LTRFDVATVSERPDLLSEMQELGGSAWPAFLAHDATVNRWWRHLPELAPDYQFVLVERGSGVVLACANALPIVWDGRSETLPAGGIDAVLPAGIEAIRHGQSPTAASALMIVVRPEVRGQGLSGACVRALRAIVEAHGLASLVAPVRPIWKDRYPLIPLERYAYWRRPDGALFDPWLRVHEQAGAELVGVAPRSMYVAGTAAEWERWTGMTLPETGSYVVPGALVPVEVDSERDEGVYVEPNFWMHHHCGDAPV
jgi:GNAT superfamily N-acetyltransferase